MSEVKKNINEVGAEEMLEEFGKSEAAQEAERIVAEAAAEPHAEDNTEEWSGRIEVEVGSEVRRWALRQKRDAYELALLSWLTVAGCAVAWMTGIWKPIVAGIAVVNLMMTGAWWHKAKAGWSV